MSQDLLNLVMYDIIQVNWWSNPMERGGVGQEIIGITITQSAFEAQWDINFVESIVTFNLEEPRGAVVLPPTSQ